jgi:two-component system chemotaxis response regulator CheY
MRILLVDDYKSMIKILRRLMEQLGFTNIDEACDGAQARALLETNEYGLILSDWWMEPVSGMDLLKHVRSAGRNRSAPFVMVTAEARNECIVAARDAGASNYIVKPFDAAALQLKLQSVLGDW